jgi:bile acid-coenzyme A ligase
VAGPAVSGPAPGPAIGTALADLTAADPVRPAVTCAGRTVSRLELELRTNRLARAYRELGVTPDSLVTIGLPNGIDAVEATVAVWKAGATPQPVSHRLPPGELAAILDLAEPSLVVGLDPSALPSASPAVDGPAVDGPAVGSARGRSWVPAGFEPDPSVPDRPLPPRVARALKAPTSGGSTGRPKLIVSGQPATAADVTVHAVYSRMRRDGVHLAAGPLHHNGPFIYAFAALLMGNHVVVMPRFDAAEALALVERHRVDWMYAVPTMMHRIWGLPDGERERHDLGSLATVMHMAAPCPPWLKRAWIGWLGPERILELYGGTEGQLATLIDGVEWLAHPGSVGRPLIGELQVRDGAGAVLSAGEVGTVWMRPPPGLPPSYRYVGATARADGDGWETLGDVGRLDADGYLYLTDRDTDMIVVGGSNVYPAEVEAALSEHPAVADACVIGLPDDDLGSRPHALVHLAPAASAVPVTDADLASHLRDRLAPYKIPRTFERVDAPLRDDAGKVRRSALRAARLNTRPGPATRARLPDG